MFRRPTRRSVVLATLGAAAASGAPGALAAPALVARRSTLSVADAAFGQAGTGGDDAASFEACIAAAIESGARSILVPASADGYRLERSVVAPIKAGRLRIVGEGAASLITVAFDGPGLVIEASLTTLENLNFMGGRGGAATALRFAKQSNPDDVDATVTGCTFMKFNRAVEHVGRGLLLRGNTFAACDLGVGFDWPTGRVAAKDGPLHNAPLGFRKIIATDNLGHALSRFFENASEAPLIGAQLNNNHMDIGRSFWSGPIAYSQMRDNMVRNCKRTPIVVTGPGRGLDISGQYGGTEEPDPPSESVHQPDWGVEFETDEAADEIKIDIQAFQVRRGGVRFRGGVTRSDIRAIVSRATFDAKPDAAVIVGGDIRNARFAVVDDAASGSDRPVVRTGGDVSGATFDLSPAAGTPLSVRGRADGSLLNGRSFPPER
ncbi:hypothetical protein [Methylopila turkensis]|uniref:Pectate lyase superfamily protein domain-containing protein n=1 Tax=Methylopila turkensis TaxID=1437816 RepID=A0A9W6JKS5_9HYPH|nr:hypothetical protein [Methylopila turkensis]GLK79471.1 hypothetical protein GCM10008174_12120 [Methylopila turkensis]